MSKARAGGDPEAKVLPICPECVVPAGDESCPGCGVVFEVRDALLTVVLDRTTAKDQEVLGAVEFTEGSWDPKKRIALIRTPEEWGWCVETLTQVAQHAEREGVTLALEPINRFETYFLNIVEDVLELVEEIGSPNIKVHVDTFHANIEEKDTAAAIRAAGANLGHFHVSESDRGVPGTGQVHWRDIFSALKEIGYDGWAAIESFGSHMEEIRAAAAIWRPLAPNDEAIAVEGLAFMRKMWDEA